MHQNRRINCLFPRIILTVLVLRLKHGLVGVFLTENLHLLQIQIRLRAAPGRITAAVIEMM